MMRNQLDDLSQLAFPLADAPVAVALFGTTVLILEDGNRRVQAVDTGGDPVPLFQGGTASTFALVQQSNQVFLDLAVEGLGRMDNIAGFCTAKCRSATRAAPS